MLDVFGGGSGESPTPQLTTEQISAAMAAANVKWLRFAEVVSWHIEHEQPFPTEYVTSILNFCRANNMKLYWCGWKVDYLPSIETFKAIQTYIAGFEDIVYVGFKTNSGGLEPDKGFKYVRGLFAHWGSMMIAELSNGNPVSVMKLLGLKSVENAMKYVSIWKLGFRTETEYEFLAVTSPEELKVALLGGYQFVIEKFGASWFRRPKRIAIAGTPINQRLQEQQSTPLETSINKRKPTDCSIWKMPYTPAS